MGGGKKEWGTSNEGAYQKNIGNGIWYENLDLHRSRPVTLRQGAAGMWNPNIPFDNVARVNRFSCFKPDTA